MLGFGATHSSERKHCQVPFPDLAVANDALHHLVSGAVAACDDDAERWGMFKFDHSPNTAGVASRASGVDVVSRVDGIEQRNDMVLHN